MGVAARLADARLWRTIISHAPQIIECEICGCCRLCIQTDPFPLGARCLGCRGTGIHRGIYAVLQGLFGRRLERLAGASIYELSAHGAVFSALRRRSEEIGFNVTCSEFVDGVAPGARRIGGSERGERSSSHGDRGQLRE